MPLKNKVTKTRCSLILLLGGNQGSEELFTAAPPDGRRLDRQSHHPPPEKKRKGGKSLPTPTLSQFLLWQLRRVEKKKKEGGVKNPGKKVGRKIASGSEGVGS